MELSEFLEECKNDETIPLIWIDEEEKKEKQIIAKSDPILKPPFNVEYYIFLVEKENKLYLKFNIDHKEKYLILINSKNELMDFLNLYLKGIEVTLNTNEIPLTNILQFIQNKSSKKIENVPLKWNSVK